MRRNWWILFIGMLLMGLLVSACGKSDDGDTFLMSAAEEVIGDLDEPSGSNGSYVISMAGGAGIAGSGGDGYKLYLSTYANSGIYVKKETVDTDFDVPSPDLPEYLGTNSATITTDTTISVVATEPADAGTLYLVSGSYYLYKADGDAGATTLITDASQQVTGLKVDEDVTLTLELNRNYNGSGEEETVYLNFADDVIINGTLVTDDLADSTGELRHGAQATARDKGSVYLDISGRFTLGEDGLIDTAGDDATVADDNGGDAGLVNVYADGGCLVYGDVDASGGDGLGTGVGGYGALRDNNNPANVYFYSSGGDYGGSIVNTGAINTSGGSGATGGNAAEIYLYGYGKVYNTGALTANGGTGTAGNGGSAGYIDLESGYASLYNEGALTANGGSGTANGGSASYVYLYSADSDYSGDVINAGNITANGGSSTSAGNGGDGADIYIEADGGDVITDGVITANGGAGAGATGVGGTGGYLYFYADYGDDPGNVDEVMTGMIQVTNNISLNGGAGALDGGDGGYLVIENSYYGDAYPPLGEVRFVGYASIDLSGGDGAVNGGDGGDISMYTEDAEYADVYYPVGALVLRSDLDLSGGDGTTSGYGGDGGYIDMQAEGEAYFGTTVAKTSGDMDLSGGAGVTAGGDSGGLYVYGHDYAENTGDITITGGVASDDAGDAETVYAGSGAYDYVEIYSAAGVLNSGDIVATGGAATGTATGTGHVYGGYSSYFYLMGVDSSVNTGDLTFNGGASTDEAGDGAYVEIDASKAEATNSGDITVAGGAGGNVDGDDGYIYLDGFDMTGTDGTL